MDFFFWKDILDLYMYIEQKELTPEAAESSRNNPSQHFRFKK